MKFSNSDKPGLNVTNIPDVTNDTVRIKRAF
jgi:hypothetical protein